MSAVIEFKNKGALMGDQVYRIGDVRDKVLALLRKERGAVKAGAICLKLAMPYWAVKAGIESALVGRLVVYVPGEGYRIASGEAPAIEAKEALAPVDVVQEATNLIA